MKKTNGKAVTVLALCILICAAACVAAAVTALSAMGMVYGLAPGVGEILAYLYQINALLCAIAIVFACAVIFGRESRNGAEKGAMWGMLILAVMYVTPFVTDTLSYLSSMDFMAAFRYLCAYIPFLAFIAAAVSALTTWHAEDRSAAERISMVSTLVSVFADVVYLWQIVPALADASETFDAAQLLSIIFGFVTVTLLTAEIWSACTPAKAAADSARAAQEQTGDDTSPEQHQAEAWDDYLPHDTETAEPAHDPSQTWQEEISDVPDRDEEH